MPILKWKWQILHDDMKDASERVSEKKNRFFFQLTSGCEHSNEKSLNENPDYDHVI